MRYVTSLAGATAYFDATGITLVMLAEPEVAAPAAPADGWPALLQPPAPWVDATAAQTSVVRLKLEGARPVTPRGVGTRRTVVSYFRGPPDKWVTAVPTYDQVVYPAVRPGLDLRFTVAAGRLTMTGLGDDPAAFDRVRLVAGGTATTRGPGQELAIKTPQGAVVVNRVQELRAVQGLWQRVADALALWPAPRNHELRRAHAVNAIDTGYVNYLGGNAWDRALGVAVDHDGNAYVVGSTRSSNGSFATIGGPDLTFNGGIDAYIGKFDPQGGAVYLGFVGGSGQDEAFDVAVDAAGSAYFTGVTDSNANTFPVRNGPGALPNGGWDGYVVKLSPDGTAIEYAGYLGGNRRDFGEGIAVDAAGAAYVTGVTESTEATFPVKTGPDVTFNGQFDAFVAKVVPQPVAGAGVDNLAYAGYIGGSGDDIGVADAERRQLTASQIAVDAAGSAYVSGMTNTDDGTFPDGDGWGELPGPDQTYNGGSYDAWVTKVRADGAGLVYAGLVGGADFDVGFGMAVDPTGAAYFGGLTGSDETTFPDGDGFGALRGPDLTYNGGNDDAFVAKVAPDGRQLVWAGYIGGDQFDVNYGLGLDSTNSVYLSGFLQSSAEPTFPVKRGPDLTANDMVDNDCGPAIAPRPCGDAWIAKLIPDPTGANPLDNIDYAGYIGGDDFEHAFWIAVHPDGKAFVVGDTFSEAQSFPNGDGIGGRLGERHEQLGDRDGFLVSVVDTSIVDPTPTPRTPTPTATATALPSHTPATGAILYLPQALRQ